MNKKQQDSKENSPKWLKPTLDYIPLIAFFISYQFVGLIQATIVLVGFTALLTIAGWLIYRQISALAIITSSLVAFFGGLTIIFNDGVFIKMKPTIVNLLFAAALMIGLMLNRLWVKKFMASTITLPDPVWRRLTWHFSFMFIILALLNEWAWRFMSESFWVSFKLFGLTSFSFLFIMAHIPYILKHQKHHE